jgi:hypothetical protein
MNDVLHLATTKPEAEIATDLKVRFEAAMAPALAIMDEAVQQGLAIQFDGIALQPPRMKTMILNLRIAKHY